MEPKTSLLVLPLVFLFACGAPAMSARPTPPVPPRVPGVEQMDFALATAAFVEHEKANDWSLAACKEVASRFDAIGTAPAAFDAGLAYQRCGMSNEARARFEAALAKDPSFHHARVQIALHRYEADGNFDAAIRVLEQVAVEEKFQNVPALVSLATLQMQRDGASDTAKLNLQRALAIDDAYMPAYNQLAIHHLRSAQKRTGRVQQLELALLVCSQAIKKNASYAPIHNTAGLILSELGRINGAVAEFATAMKLDPKLFEAQMNYAFVNLGFRGFEEAQAAFARALVVRPNDYDAHLGMALALRGPITGMESDLEARVASVQAELDAAKRIDPSRPDAYFNEGVLTQELKAKSATDKEKTKATLRHAGELFQTFLEKAAGKPQYDVAVKRVPERLSDIDATLKFL